MQLTPPTAVRGLVLPIRDTMLTAVRGGGMEAILQRGGLVRGISMRMCRRL